MKIGIAGYGFVGQAHQGVLKDYHDIIISDPAKKMYGDLRQADAIIICVSTPQGSHGGVIWITCMKLLKTRLMYLY